MAQSSTVDPATKRQAIDYLQTVKQDPQSVHFFINLLIDEQQMDQLTVFVSLQMLTDLVNMENALFIKNNICNFVQKKINNQIVDVEFIRNKIAELITKLFLTLYGEFNGNQWNNFFIDLIQLCQITSLQNDTRNTELNDINNNNPTNIIAIPGQDFSILGLDYFLRITIAINSEIADQTFIRSKDLQLKNNSLKDHMRLQDTQIISIVWLNSLKSIISQQLNNSSNTATTTTTTSSNANNHLTIPNNLKDIANLTLSCIGVYISWIDANLIINEDYINTIYQFLNFDITKIPCAKCLCEILSKKMKPMEKLTLITMLNVTDKLINFNNFNNNDNVEIDEQLSKLVSSMGLELAIILEQCYESNDIETNLELQQVITAADDRVLNQVVPLVLKFMSHEYDSVTQQSFPFITQYLSVLKKLFALGGKPGSAIAMNSKRQPLDETHSNFLIELLKVIFIKVRIDDSSEEDDEDEIEEFIETIRNKLKIFQDSICVINPTIYFENVSQNIQNLLINQKDWRDMELAIFQMHNLSESIRNNLFGINKQEIFTSPAATTMMKFMSILLQNTAIFQIDNSYVEITFFELVVRHHTFLNGEKDVTALLNIFCSEFGMFNKREKVRVRTWYLFTRFIKMTKPKYPIVILSEIINKLNCLLTIKIVNIKPDGTDDDSTFDNQMYLFEGIGLLIGANSDANYDILDTVLSSLFSDLERCISSQIQSPEVVLQCHHILMAIGTLARGVHGGLVPENQVNNALVNKKLINKSLFEKFSNIAEVVLVTFSYFNKHETIRDASRFTFSRLIPILNSDIIPFANKLIAIFLDSELKMLEMNDFLGFLGQMVHTFHKDENCLELFTNLLAPVVDKVHQVLNLIENDMNNSANNPSLQQETIPSNEINNNQGKNIIVTDSFRDKVLLKKSYFAFLQSFITNSVTSLLLAPNNSNALSIILTDLLTYTPAEIQETSTMKLALNVLVNLVRCFGSGKCMDPQDPHASDVPKVEGLNEFLISKIVPLVFEIPFNSEYKFDIKEGTYRVVVCDLSRLLREIYLQSGGGSDINSNPCLKYLSEIYLPQIQFPTQLIMELMENLVTTDQKNFEKYYVSLITKLKS